MALTGYRRAGGTRRGGIKSIALIRSEAVTGAQYDPGSGSYTAVFTVPGEKFSVYAFKEDGAAYGETVSCENGPVTVGHTLSLMLEKIDEASARAVEEMCMASYGGMIAIVTTNNGVSFLVGYSEKFGTRYPLRLSRSVGTSGSVITDISAENLVLTSVDAAKARIYTGNVPV